VPARGEDLVCPLDFRYGRPEARRLFTRRARLDRWLSVEAALAEASAEAGLFPESDARAIRRAAEGGRVTVARVDALERETRHDIMALTRALSERAGPAGRWVHFGATSNDILDTALGLELKASVGLLRPGLTALLSALHQQAWEHRGTAMVARTHGQQAVPFTFGYKLTGFLMEFLRHRDRLDQMGPRLSVGKIAGAVGTGAGFGDRAEAIEAGTLARLGLGREEAPSQLVGRDRLAEFLGWTALVASSCDRLATEVRNLQRTEIAEVQEPFDESAQVGSSTMAQKRNPINAENVSSLARYLRSLPGVALENMVQWHERDLANSANERFLVPHGVLLLDDMLARLTRIVVGLRVDRDRMRENLSRGQGATMAEALMLALTERGVPRATAHEWLRGLTRGLGPEAVVPLSRRAARDRHVREFLGPKEVGELLDPARYVEASRAKTERILTMLRGRLD
jgi:adenylosuccinate lyase